MSNARESRLRSVALVTTLVLGILACAADRGARDARQHAWMGERGIVVPHDSFPADCTLCHTGDDWNTLRDDFAFDHLAQTGVALVGAHAEAQCLRCHNDRGPVETFAARGCAGCHQDVHQGTLGSRCTDCHDESSWRASPEVASHQRTRFPLVGAHLATPCFACHPGGEVGNWVRVDVSCTTCHAEDAASAQDPDHVAQGWTTDCQRCHVPTSWVSGFVHSFFPLTGQHAVTDCESCHAGGEFGPLSSDCYDCHRADFEGAQDPDHVANDFPTNCALCHDTSTWEGAMFSHAGISSGCIECHQTDYDRTRAPNHAASGFPTSCEQCHLTNAWVPAEFDHGSVSTGCVQCHLLEYQRTTDPDHEATGIPTNCELCHGTRTWLGAGFDHTGIRSGCVECHLDDYKGVRDPDHVAGGFPTTCEQCHDTRTWEGAEFDHTGIRGGCVECHLEEYQQTRRPNHAASGFPTSCEQCHTTRSWPGASFDHSSVSSGCVQCHLVDYQRTNDPNHAAAGFPTSCELCHGTRGWTPADFDHSFPIDNGDHAGLDCADCHVNPRNFNVFTCTDCHAHEQRDMDDEHDDVRGYVYVSSACYACHPNGRER